MDAMLKRMGFFDDLKSAADTLVTESAGVMTLARNFKQALEQCRDDIFRNFNDEEIKENMGDVDFANDFAASFYEALEELRNKAIEISDKCIVKKHKLDNALTQINSYDALDGDSS